MKPTSAPVARIAEEVRSAAEAVSKSQQLYLKVAAAADKNLDPIGKLAG
jgi:hypothetical protein